MSTTLGFTPGSRRPGPLGQVRYTVGGRVPRHVEWVRHDLTHSGVPPSTSRSSSRSAALAAVAHPVGVEALDWEEAQHRAHWWRKPGPSLDDRQLAP